MKKHIANIITSTRIIASMLLLAFASITNGFIAIYVYCGFTDLIDGPVARKTKAESLLGAKLDTAGDVLTYLALTKILIINNLIPIGIFIWFCTSVVGLIASAFIAKKRHGKFYFVHSLFGKILGATIFLLPFAMRLVSHIVCMGVICSVSSIAAIESIIIQLKTKSIQLNISEKKSLPEEIED